MNSQNCQPDQISELRRRAEQIARENYTLSLEYLQTRSPEEIQRMFHELQVHQIEIEMQNEDLRGAEAELETTRARYFDLFELAPVGYLTLTQKGVILGTNLTAATLLGVARSALSNQPLAHFILPEDKDIYYHHRKKLFETGAPQQFELQLRKADGALFYAQLDAIAATDTDGTPVCRVTMIDISVRKIGENRERLFRDILASLNHSERTTDTISDILRILKKSTGFSALGLRLREADDFPYYQTIGFSDHFVESERYLCVHDATGRVVCDTQGQPELACMCGVVLRGRIDPRFPFFTEGGSFWCNSTTDLLASTTEEDRQAITRNHCNRAGYESVALVPLRVGNEIIGLLQFNDHRRHQFTPKMIAFFEGLGASIGIALSRTRAEEALRKSEKRLRAILRTAMDGFWLSNTKGCLLEVNETYCRMSGYSAEELLTMSTSDLEANETVEETIAHRQKIMAQGEDRFESRHRRKDGSIFDVEVCVQYQPSDGGWLVAFLRDITARKRAENSLRLLSSRLLTSQEEEQRRIAMELHDQTGQDLNVLKLHLATLQSRLRKDQTELKKEYDKILTFTDGIIEDVRRLAHGLSPSQLEVLGLCAAVKALMQNFSRKTGICVRYDVNALDTVFPQKIQIILYRIFQEALTNIYKHARAETVRIEVTRQGDALSIDIKDDGQGFDPCAYPLSDPATGQRGMGLSAMELRARMIGADFSISSLPGKGTQLNLLIPLNCKRANA